jgi:predicted nucleotidyltransferase
MTAMGPDLPLQFPVAALESVCRRFHVRRLLAFGSVLRSDFSSDSDVDLLVEFQPGRTPGLAFFRLEADLSAVFGRRVDLNTRASLSPYFRDRALDEARALYVEA